jgi:hypothetical protein
MTESVWFVCFCIVRDIMFCACEVAQQCGGSGHTTHTDTHTHDQKKKRERERKRVKKTTPATNCNQIPAAPEKKNRLAVSNACQVNRTNRLTPLNAKCKVTEWRRKSSWRSERRRRRRRRDRRVKVEKNRPGKVWNRIWIGKWTFCVSSLDDKRRGKTL